MLILCETCGATTRVELDPPPDCFCCEGCGRQESLSAVGETPSTTRQAFEQSRGGSKENGSGPAQLSRRYDPGFEKAVSEGLMTVRQAMERGNRRQFAATISRRYGLSIDRALEVADGRRSISALPRPRGRKGIALRSTNGRQRQIQTATTGVTVSVGLAGLFVLGGLWVLAAREQAGSSVGPGPERITLEESRQILGIGDQVPAEILTDGEGQVTQVIGTDPLSVLNAYCESWPKGGSPIVAVDVVHPISGAHTERVGVFRDRNEAAVLRGIVIREEGSTQRWIAGNGREPVSLVDAPGLPPR